MRKRLWIILAAIGLAGVGSAVYLIARPSRADEHRKAAIAALQQRDFQQAQIHFDRYLEIRPDDLDARLLAAQAARRHGDFAEAQRHLQFFREKQGSAGKYEREQQLMRAQDGEGTDVLLEQVARNPQEADAYLILEAVIEGKLKNLERAFAANQSLEEGQAAREVAATVRTLDLCEPLIAGENDRIQLLVWRGRLHLLTQDYPKACALLREALRLDPEHFEARLKLAAAVGTENPREAAWHLENLRQRYPKDDRVRFPLASLYRAFGELEAAAQILDEMLATNPDVPSTLLERGRVAVDAKNLTDAEKWLRHGLALAPNVPDMNLALSRCLQLAGKEDEARYFLQRYQQLDAEQRTAKAPNTPARSP